MLPRSHPPSRVASDQGRREPFVRTHVMQCRRLDLGSSEGRLGRVPETREGCLEPLLKPASEPYRQPLETRRDRSSTLAPGHRPGCPDRLDREIRAAAAPEGRGSARSRHPRHGACPSARRLVDGGSPPLRPLRSGAPGHGGRRAVGGRPTGSGGLGVRYTKSPLEQPRAVKHGDSFFWELGTLRARRFAVAGRKSSLRGHCEFPWLPSTRRY
jgi:hypothetical protein